jgi:MFS family permease
MIGVRSPSAPAAIAGMLAGTFLMAGFVGPIYARMMALAPDGARGTLLALVTVLSNLIGYGCGPVLIGIASDLLGGTRSLSAAIGIVLTVPLAGAALLVASARRADREAGASADAEEDMDRREQERHIPLAECPGTGTRRIR